MRRVVGSLVALAGVGAAVWYLGGDRAAGVASLPGGAKASRAASAAASGTSLACNWKRGEDFAFDVSIESALTFDGSALVPVSASTRSGSTAHTQDADAKGRLEAKVLSVTPRGHAVMAVRLASWTSDVEGADAFPDIDAQVRRPYLLQVDSRCHILSAARSRGTSVIAFRRVLAVLDRMDFALPSPSASPASPYTNRQVDDYGWYSIENRYEPAPGRGAITRRRVAYDVQPAGSDQLEVEIRIRAASGSVGLGDGTWFARIDDSEDIDVVSNGAVPLRSRSSTAFTSVAADSRAFDGANLNPVDFVWGRPTEAELEAAHEALRSSAWAGLPVSDAVAKFLALRDGGAQGAWQESQRMLRDWMRANPDGVRSLGAAMASGKYGVGEQADFALAMARSGSAAARLELERIAADTSVSTDLRVQAASACADLKSPTTGTVDVLARLAEGARTGTPDDMLPSTATMSLGTIIDNAPGTPAAARARDVLMNTLSGSDRARVIEALSAASNSGDPAFTDVALAKTASEDAQERGAAAHALRKMPPTTQTGGALGALLHEDTNPEVVKQVAETRREQMQTYGGGLSQQELALFATKLPSAPEGVRWEILRTLGQASRTQGTARQVLIDWYHEEDVDSLKMVIGQYVKASDLRN